MVYKTKRINCLVSKSACVLARYDGLAQPQKKLVLAGSSILTILILISLIF